MIAEWKKREIFHLRCSEGSGILVAQAGVLLDVLDEGDQGRLVDPPVLEVVLLLPKHPLSCTSEHLFGRQKKWIKEQWKERKQD